MWKNDRCRPQYKADEHGLTHAEIPKPTKVRRKSPFSNIGNKKEKTVDWLINFAFEMRKPLFQFLNQLWATHNISRFLRSQTQAENLNIVHDLKLGMVEITYLYSVIYSVFVSHPGNLGEKTHKNIKDKKRGAKHSRTLTGALEDPHATWNMETSRKERSSPEK